MERSTTVCNMVASGRGLISLIRRAKSLGCGFSPPLRLKDAVRRTCRRVMIFSSDGSAWTRYKPKCLFFCKKSAAQTLAVNMHSSIKRWASLRVRGSMRKILPSSFEIIWVSVVSKSSAPRFSRADNKILNKPYKLLSSGRNCANRAASGPLELLITSHTAS